MIGLLLAVGCVGAFAQDAKITPGSLIVTGRAKVGGKTVNFKRKRFYLFRGDRTANKALIENLTKTSFTSRDCFYCGKHASKEFMDWLKEGGGYCESPFCRVITEKDVAKVPEFQTAYQDGIKAFENKPKFAPIFALKWLVTNLKLDLRTGFYNSRENFLTEAQKGLPAPVQSSMTDNSGSPPAYFSNIKLTKPVEKFTYTNLVPIEIGQKSYIWVCDVEIGKGKKKNTPSLDVPPESDKPDKPCTVIVRDLPECKADTCEQK